MQLDKTADLPSRHMEIDHSKVQREDWREIRDIVISMITSIVLAVFVARPLYVKIFDSLEIFPKIVI